MKKLWIVLILCSLAFTPLLPSRSTHAYLECHRYRWELHPHLLVIKCHQVQLERGDTAPTPYVNPTQLILLPWR
jgi:hypothetical protein